MNGRAVLLAQALANLPGVNDLLAERARRRLHSFLRDFAWPVLYPGTKFIDNWHVGAICEHLEAVKMGQIKRLIINMPFRMLKSTIVSQAFPAWEWIDAPHIQYLTASYAKDVATRDAVDCRRIIESTAYQQAWGYKFRMTSDQNVKTRYENDKRGARTVTSTDGAATGFGGNRVIVDDPVSAKEANSPLALATSVEWWKGTASTRMNNPEDDALVLVHQRLNEKDLTGHILSEETGWEHLILPMRFERKYAKTTSLGFADPRKTEGELLFPKRLGEDTVADMEGRLGTYHTNAQLQQRPTSRGGSVLKSDWFPRYKVLPKIIRRRIYGDTAQKTKERHDYSVLECWGLGDNGKIYLIDLLRGKWEAHELEKKVVDFWNKHKDYDELLSAPLSKMLIEDKSSGTGLIQNIKKRGAIPVHGVSRSVDKLTRAYDGQPSMEAGLVCLPEEAPWMSVFCAEVDAFTKDDSHDHDDQIDPMLDAINDLIAKRGSIYDTL